MSMFDKLTPEQQRAVVSNVAKRLGSNRPHDFNTIAARLRGSDQATGQAMDYLGMPGVPPNFKENGGRTFDVNQIIDQYATDTGPTPQAAPAGRSTGNGGQQGVVGSDGKTPVPNSNPNRAANTAGDAETGGNGNAIATILGVGGGTIAAIYALKKLYDKYKAGAASPDEIKMLNDVKRLGVDPESIPTMTGEAEAGPERNIVDGDFDEVPQLTDQRQNGVAPDDGMRGPDGGGGMPPQVPRDPSGGALLPPQSSYQGGNTRALEQLLAERAAVAASQGAQGMPDRFVIPNVDIGVQGVQEGGYAAPLLDALKKPRVRVKAN